MKIAMIGHKRVPGREGGIEVVVEELSTRMISLGHKVVAYNRRSKKYPKYKEFQGVKIINVPTIERKSLDAVVYSFLASIYALFGHFDLIHYHGIGPSVFLLIPHLLGKKTVVTVHGLNYKTPKWKGFGAKFMRLGEKITAKYADEIIVLSQEQADYFKVKYNRKTAYIPNGVTAKSVLSPNVIKEKYDLTTNGYILFLSRLVPGKGVEYLINAYKQIDCELPLIIAGDAPFVDDFNTRIKELAKEDRRIHFIGFVEGEELQELYSNTRLFVFPSEAEGMPMCLLEAMSYGVPCLVSDIPENVEVGKDYVTTFKSKDTMDLKMKLENLLKEPFMSQKEKMTKYIYKNYDWDKVVEKTICVYEGRN
ncbi:MAG: glycosyltransferase family 4 protein [Blautia sp.]